MTQLNTKSALTMGISILLGLGLLGYFVEQAAVKFKEYDRIVTVKGLSEREVPADTVIWPIQFTLADNELPTLFTTLDAQTQQVMQFLAQQGIDTQSISISAPAVIDKKAQQYGGEARIEYRYLATQTLTVYSTHLDLVRQAISQIGQLGKQGIVFNQDNYNNRVEYLFSGLNDIKPAMIEEATKQAREVAEKFAKDSQSSLGKIKRATQGQFSIVDRDNNTPYVKKVRVVSTVEYFLSD
ncbi:SIMPL domain-containing protein [Vibrio fluvialis]|uniref:SIMPL domain-containing protein n=1 Tax=Vibrio sp. bablab_jr001 TaxID=2755067 RepID=UPI0018F144BB|nr:SIMPL domain-containing protein [Vibrio sp. bablab_jr001]EKO3398515.1 SIMPL domain-containing protein [Vibrio fluvialis]EKO3471817.1 SIMPL domain-containing protein [Vibrio fluvialis]MBY8115332.1 SIMPL domain-containing protein [Vibrio fluvialis]MBY8248424.1 SIMPL domain-containing protein [Vibrio fluvialis]MBY8282093.1 SIMPL domain-containing protein [Vibrio fluvialis]